MDALLSLSSALSGRYTVEREIGAGGMATVYLASDVRHERKVALKVLRPELGAVLGVERFLAEIKVTANLQHPNLLPLFDSGEANGLLFYVMPFVAGESLRERLLRERQLPVDEAVRIAVGIARALHYAHQHGVIHRDLKPENILLQAGQPVVADFGIALAVSNAGGTRITQTGLSLGTPQYMSPEQATGDHAIDGRTDIYSLGAVLYEMLTGEPPHIGNSAQAIIARLLTDKPRPVRLVRDTVPVHIEAAIDKALAKLPADRFATPDEFAEALQERIALPASARATAGHTTRRTTPRRLAWIASPLPWVAALVLAATAAAWGWLRRPEGPMPPAVRFTLALPAEARLETNATSNLAISPDGRRIVYAGQSAAGRQLYVRNVDELEVHPIAGTNSATAPAVSPDGRWVAWNLVGRLRKTPLDGGVSVDITLATSFQGVAWISNDELLVSSAAKGGIAGLWRVSATGGAVRRFTAFDSVTREGIQSDPVVLHEHGIVLYTSYRLGSLIGRLGVARLEGGSSRILDLSVDRVLGFALGHVIYISEDRALMATPFDPRTMQTTGAPIDLVQGVDANSAALSPAGTIAYAQGASTSEVVTVDERGASTLLFTERARYAHPRLSPDGKRLAIDITSGSTTDVWTFDVASGTPTRLTTSANNDRPEWTADGARLLYSSTRGADEYSIWWQPADGSGPAEQLFRGPNAAREVSLTPDGRSLIYREDHPDSLRDIRMAPVGVKDSSAALVSSRFDELMPRLSPDGRWLAYQSNESGKYEIYVRPFPQGGGRITISNGGGTEPIWSRDGRLFYRNGRDLVAVAYSAVPAFAVTSRKVLFAGTYELHPFHPNYDVTPDGKHFIMIRPGNEEVQVVVVVNWIEELRRRLGVAQ